MKIRLLGLLVLLCALSSGCRKPGEQFYFVYTPSHPADTFVFKFDMPMDEPSASYATRFACRFRGSAIGGENIPMMVEVTSPSGEKYLENIDMPLASNSDRIRRSRDGGLSDIDWPYRDNIRPGRDTGLWQVAIRPVDRSLYEEILGMGFTYKEK